MGGNGQAAPEPVLLERGRYALRESPDGSWVVSRAVGTCETCRDCGCGDQADPIVIPAMVVALAKARDGGGMMAKLKGMVARG
jgi:hypothetical protein